METVQLFETCNPHCGVIWREKEVRLTFSMRFKMPNVNLALAVIKCTVTHCLTELSALFDTYADVFIERVHNLLCCQRNVQLINRNTIYYSRCLCSLMSNRRPGITWSCVCVLRMYWWLWMLLSGAVRVSVVLMFSWGHWRGAVVLLLGRSSGSERAHAEEFTNMSKPCS